MDSAVKTKVQHTPGPWRAEVKPDVMTARVFGPKHADGGDYAELFTTTNKANAHLIAAAPEMYEALLCAESALAAYQRETGHMHGTVYETVKAAIAKAEGRQ
jgi:hypothetical protein